MEQIAITGIQESGGLIAQAGTSILTLFAFFLLICGLLVFAYIYYDNKSKRNLHDTNQKIASTVDTLSSMYKFFEDDLKETKRNNREDHQRIFDKIESLRKEVLRE